MRPAVLSCTVSKQALVLAEASSRGKCYLSSIVDIFKLIFGPEALENPDVITTCYKVHIKEDFDPKKKKKSKRSSGWGAASTAADAASGSGAGRILSFWCFSPGVSVMEIEKHDTHSIIMTSGTLSPLPSFISELRAPFPITLENSHVIDAHQLWVGVIRTGPVTPLSPPPPPL